MQTIKYSITKVTIVEELPDGKNLVEKELVGKPTAKEIKEKLKENQVFVSKEVVNKEIKVNINKLIELNKQGKLQ